MVASFAPATARLPDRPSKVFVMEHDRHYPTMPGKATDVVHMDGRQITVQCAVCLRTATGHTPWWVIVVHHWNHAPDKGTALGAATPYKRCPDCRDAKRHPQEAS